MRLPLPLISSPHVAATSSGRASIAPAGGACTLASTQTELQTHMHHIEQIRFDPQGIRPERKLKHRQYCFNKVDRIEPSP
jgi:hypothetical protein